MPKKFVSAKLKSWKTEARQLMASGNPFRVVHLTPSAILDCILIAKECGYDCHQAKEFLARRESALQKSDLKMPTDLILKKIRPKSLGAC